VVFFGIDASGDYWWDPELDNPAPQKILLVFSRFNDSYRKGKTECGVKLEGGLIEQLIAQINKGKIDGTVIYSHQKKRVNHFEIELDRDEFWDFYYRFNESTT
jgi:hypothetical protein